MSRHCESDNLQPAGGPPLQNRGSVPQLRSSLTTGVEPVHFCECQAGGGLLLPTRRARRHGCRCDPLFILMLGGRSPADMERQPAESATPSSGVLVVRLVLDAIRACVWAGPFSSPFLRDYRCVFLSRHDTPSSTAPSEFRYRRHPRGIAPAEACGKRRRAARPLNMTAK